MARVTTIDVIRNATTSYRLERATGYMLSADGGLGMSPLHRLSDRGPMEHGATDEGYRLDPRLLKLVFQLFAADDDEYWEMRDQLLRIVRPGTLPIQLLFTLVTGKQYQIDVHFAAEANLDSSERQRITHKVAVVFKTHQEPTFYDPEGSSLTFGVGGVASAWAVPLSVPMVVGATSVITSKTLTYDGSWPDLPLVRIRGPITNPIVTNLTTNEKLSFTGHTISTGDYYDINCGFGEKTVVDSLGVSQIWKLSDDSDLDTFHLEADPDSPGGRNDIQVSGTGVTSASEVFILYRNRYIGF